MFLPKHMFIIAGPNYAWWWFPKHQSKSFKIVKQRIFFFYNVVILFL